MSINRIPDWRSPHYDMSPRDLSPVETWSMIHVREHAEESIARIQDFEDLTQFATREYVDDSIGIVLDYHFNNATANIDEETETTYNMESIEYAGKESITRTTITSASNQLLYCFATLAGEPGGIDLPHGPYDAHFHLEVATGGGARSVDVHWTLSSIDADGTNESPIMISETVAGVSGGETEYTIHANLDTDVTVGSSSRLLFKVYGNGNVGSNTTMQFYVEGDTGTHFTMKATASIFNTIYIRQDGTTPLTSNWDIGNYTFTASGLTIDGTFTDGTMSMAGGNLTSVATLGIGTTTVPHGGVGAAKLAIEGASASVDGPHIQITTLTDNFPLMQIHAWRHDFVNITFDAYGDAVGWKSSDVGSNYRINKENDLLTFNYASGVAVDDTTLITWNAGIVLDTSGGVSMPNLASGANQGASGAAVGELWHDTTDNTVKMGA